MTLPEICRIATRVLFGSFEFVLVVSGFCVSDGVDDGGADLARALRINVHFVLPGLH